MDSLDHMLTDPLELGPCGDGHGTRIMEDCLLGDTRVSLPEDLLEDVSRRVPTTVSSLSPQPLLQPFQSSVLLSVSFSSLWPEESVCVCVCVCSLFNHLVKEEIITYILHD